MKKTSSKSPVKEKEKQIKLEEFAKTMKPIEFYGVQRDLSAEMKRIVKNLVCQEHSYLYCPCCKRYEETDNDPLENIDKFMKFIKQEQLKLFPVKRKSENKESKRPPEMPDDSVSDITDLDKEGILTKYYGEKMSKAEKKRKERMAARRRLFGESINTEADHICKGRRMMPSYGENVEVEVRKKHEGVAMQDEENSAH